VFTGLIDDVGTIERVDETEAGREFRIRTRYRDLVEGESIACDGVCLTVRAFGPAGDGTWFTVAAVVTTLGRTALGGWTAGRRVNLERALRLGDRLGGHLVQGHVDAVGEVLEVRQVEDAWLVDVAVPREIDELLVPHGSVTVDGVSLTVNALPRPGVLQLSIIEYTHRHTTLGDRHQGDAVHLEGDVIGKYVRRLVAPHGEALAANGSAPRIPQPASRVRVAEPTPQ
jgi:riboflavin synthase